MFLPCMYGLLDALRGTEYLLVSDAARSVPFALGTRWCVLPKIVLLDYFHIYGYLHQNVYDPDFDKQILI